MKTYTGTVCFSAYQNITVEAEDADTARQLMFEQFKNTNDNTECEVWDFREEVDGVTT